VLVERSPVDGVELSADPSGAVDGRQRSGYTRDYSPVRLCGLPPAATAVNGQLVAVELTGIDQATGVLDARWLDVVEVV
jgi:hypothetical protein